jgi:hypothetical protein
VLGEGLLLIVWGWTGVASAARLFAGELTELACSCLRMQHCTYLPGCCRCSVTARYMQSAVHFGVNTDPLLLLLCRYRPGLPLVLCGLSFKVEPGENDCIGTHSHTCMKRLTVSTLHTAANGCLIGSATRRRRVTASYDCEGHTVTINKGHDWFDPAVMLSGTVKLEFWGALGAIDPS